MAIDYKNAGVNIQAGEELVDWLKQTQPANQPHAESLLSGIGGFASLFRADFSKMKKPCLITCTDGVGTKLKLASFFQKYSTVGQDLVAMCVNDLICTGGQPLLFLDYYATGELKLDAAKEFLSGLRDACIESDCLLIGGETAEMPGLYQANDFDCAGFCVGVVDEELALGAHRVLPGQKIIGVESHGFHSNGFSLLRKLFQDDLSDWQETLLRPTALYVKLAKALTEQNLLSAMAHITGGGMSNILRVMPKNTSALLKPWKWPSEFIEVQKRAKLSDHEMLNTFNCGIGLVAFCQASEVETVHKTCESNGFKSFDLGEVTEAKDDSSQAPVIVWH